MNAKIFNIFAIILICGLIVFAVFNFPKIIESNNIFKFLAAGTGTSCGNGILEESLGEECDDGNLLAEDGCDTSCKWENITRAYSWCGTTDCPTSRIYSPIPNYSTQFSHIVPVVYVEITDTTTNVSSAAITAKTATDIQPKGSRTLLNYFYPRFTDYINSVGDKDNIIIPETCTDINDLSTCQRMQDVPRPAGCSSDYVIASGYAVNFRSPWWDNWILENQTRFRRFLEEYIAIGGKPIDYFQSDYEMGFDVGFARPYTLVQSDTTSTPCNEVELYPALNERIQQWWNGVENDPRFPEMKARLQSYGFSIPPEKTLYQYIEPYRYSWANFSTEPQKIWNSVAQEMTAEYLNRAYYDVIKQYYPNVEMTDNSNYLQSSIYPITGNLHPYGPGIKVGTHQDLGSYSNIEFNTFLQGVNKFRSAALVAPSVPFRVWLSHWSYKVESPNNQVFNLNYAKYWSENIFHSLLAGSDNISWWNAGTDRSITDRTAESTAMNTILEEFDKLTYFREDRKTLVTNLITEDTSYVLTGMNVPNHYNLYRITPNQDVGSVTEILSESPALFLINGTRILIPNGTIYRPQNNVAPYGYWIIQPLTSGSPIIESGTCVNTCLSATTEESDVCSNECSESGIKKCYDATRLQTCGSYDTDPCLEWSAPQTCQGSTSCGYGTCTDLQKPTWSCKDGKCIYTCNTDSSCSLANQEEEEEEEIEAEENEEEEEEGETPTCTDECSTRYLSVCVDNTHKKICGYSYDTDPCLEWSAPQTCQGSTSCGYGTCTDLQKPTWSCKDGKCVYTCNTDSSCKKVVTYVQNYKKACYDNDIYWFDSKNVKQSIFKDCENDICSKGECIPSNSIEYCQGDTHCGDNICNCQEDTLTCSEDCEPTNLAVVLYANDKNIQEWRNEAILKSEEEIEFMLIVKNNTSRDVDNIVVKTDLPEEIAYSGDLIVNNISFDGNIVSGINIGFIPANSEKRITFKGKVLSGVSVNTNIQLKATVATEDASVYNLMPININQSKSFLKTLGDKVVEHPIWAIMFVAIVSILSLIGLYFVYMKFGTQTDNFNE